MDERLSPKSTFGIRKRLKKEMGDYVDDVRFNLAAVTVREAGHGGCDAGGLVADVRIYLNPRYKGFDVWDRIGPGIAAMGLSKIQGHRPSNGRIYYDLNADRRMWS